MLSNDFSSEVSFTFHEDTDRLSYTGNKEIRVILPNQQNAVWKLKNLTIADQGISKKTFYSFNTLYIGGWQLLDETAILQIPMSNYVRGSKTQLPSLVLQVEPTPTDDNLQSQLIPGLENWVVYLIAAIIFVILLIVVIVVIFLCRKKAADESYSKFENL